MNTETKRYQSAGLYSSRRNNTETVLKSQFHTYWVKAGSGDVMRLFIPEKLTIKYNAEVLRAAKTVNKVMKNLQKDVTDEQRCEF